MATRVVTMRVWRGDSTGGAFREYSVSAEEGMVVLDVIHAIQRTRANDLAVRWNCKAGKCGSCSAEINGKPRLMCMTRMNLFKSGELITVAPMKTFPIIRDLVTDVSFNYEKAKTIPAFKLKPRESDGTRRMYQEDIDRGQEFHKKTAQTRRRNGADGVEMERDTMLCWVKRLRMKEKAAAVADCRSLKSQACWETGGLVDAFLDALGSYEAKISLPLENSVRQSSTQSGIL